MSKKIAFIGAGKMASAIVNGLIDSKLFQPSDIYCTCGNDSTGIDLAQATGIQYLENLDSELTNIDFLVLACKPQQIEALDANNTSKHEHLTIISILAGTPISKLRSKFPKAQNIIRSMPNTPGQIGRGVTAYSSEQPLEDVLLHSIESILGALGIVYKVPENQLDAVTAVSGSGPAYVFEFIEALTDAGVQAGLEETLALSLAKETVLGSALLLDQSNTSPEALRKAVTSPGGTTEAALNILQNGKFRNLICEAVLSAKHRSIELANS
jgi:pyrroline-5-carboxylate reductase